MRKAAFVTFTLLLAVPVKANDTTSPLLNQETRLAIEKNATAFSHLVIIAKRSAEFLVPAETALKTIDSRDTAAEFTQQVPFEIRFDDTKFRETIRFPPGKYVREKQLTEKSFDGSKFFVGEWNPTNVRAPGAIVITTPKLASEEATLRNFPGYWTNSRLWYLCEAGFSGPTELSRLGRSIESLLLTLTVEIVSVRNVGEEQEKLVEVTIEYAEPWQSLRTDPVETYPPYVKLRNGTDKLQMRIETDRRKLVGHRRFCKVLLDGTMNYAAREKWESRKESGALMFHTKNFDFTDVNSDGLWLPKRCEVDSYAYDMVPTYTSEMPLYKTIIEVESIERTPAGDEQFRIWYDAPGVTVQDYTNPHSSLRDPVVYPAAAPIDSLKIDTKAGAGPRTQGKLLIILNIVMIAALAGYFLFFHFRKPSR